jgi:hypothetical protein
MTTIVRRITARFDVGQIEVKPRAFETIDEDDFFNCFVRHMAGDWGDLDEHDWKANDDAVEFGSQIWSSYCDRRGNRFWIITKADRSSTTVMLPEEFGI